MKLALVTSNVNKYREMSEVALELGFELEMVPGLKFELQADSLEDVARISALFSYVLLGRPVIVEDAGLFIDALNGFPGVYSNYAYRTIGIRGVLKLLEGVSDRRACFRSAACIVDGSNVVLGLGEVCGEIVESPRGDKGFGFDPIFRPFGSDRTFGEMDVREKNVYSHRAMSTRKALLTFKKLIESS
ncbi:MAG: RdgB/HAM1 family non-canonical purine NTP pyrophosphatase [Desulfurococcaceae archaeon]